MRAVWCVCVCFFVCGVWCVECGAENLPVCRFKTFPCVGSKRLRLYRQNARMLNTCARFDGTHGGILNLHTGRLSLSPLLLSFSRPFFFLSLPSYFSRSPSLLSFLLSSLSATMTMITRPVGSLSLCKHGSDLPECQGACTLAHSLSGEHVSIMHETTVLA